MVEEAYCAKRRRVDDNEIAVTTQSPGKSCGTGLQVTITPKTSDQWPPFGWYERLSLRNDSKGTCKGLVRWPQTEDGWRRFLEYVHWVAKADATAPTHVWRDACSKSGVFDMTNWDRTKLIKMWPIDTNRVHAAIREHPPNQELQKMIYEAVLKRSSVPR